MHNLQIYRASAGSGKTFLLTQNFLKLAFENPLNFSKILAVTFTNKAADEMKTRIISEINEIIIKGNKAGHFKGIKEYTNLPDKQIIQRAKKIRTNILHNYSLFFVSTIDSFVQKIIRAFSYEINISSSYKLELDQDKATEELTEMLYLQISENKELQNWLIQFASDKIGQGKAWDFKKELKSLAQEIFKERYQSLKQFAFIDKNNISQLNNTLKEFLIELKKIISDFENLMEIISQKADKVIKKADFDYTKQGRNFTTICNYFIKKIKDKKYEFDTNSIVNAKEGIEFWYAKSAKADIISNIEKIYPPLYKLLLEADNTLTNKFTNYNTAKVIIKNYYSFGILKDISALLPAYRNENNLLLISDTTLLLKEIIGNNDAPFIYEKTGNRFKHVLIDEFQDTSSFQWSIFKPLIENSLSEALFNLIVGDIKQSIYRWRGGDWKLLLNGVKEQINEAQIEEKSLDTNWRSQKNIIEFNNSVFLYAPQILQQDYNRELLSITDNKILEELKTHKFNSTLIDAYKDNFQKHIKKPEKSGGKVKIKFLQSKYAQYDTEISELLPEEINNLLKTNKYKPGQIAILCRKRAEVKKTSQMLLDYMENTPGAVSYSIISTDSLYLSSSIAVRIIVNALKYISDEKDKIAFAALKYEYSKLNVKDNQNFNDIFLINESNGLPGDFLVNKENFKHKSIYEISENLISIFKLYLKDKEFPYIRAFQDIVNEYTRNENSDLPMFLAWWEEKGSTTSIQMSEEQNAVRIMTVHKSKGLAFDVVIVPYTTWKTDSTNKNSVIWAKAETEPFNKFEYFPVIKSSTLAKTIFQKDYFDEKLYNYMDALNMLYVAFTRPVSELIIYADITNNKNQINSIGDLLFNTIITSENKIEDKYINLKQYLNNDNNTFILENNHENILNLEKEKSDKHKYESISLNSYPNFDWTEKLSIHRESDEFYIESIEEIHDKVNYGILMHKILSQINTPDDIENAVDEIFYSGYISLKEKEEIILKIKDILNRSNVKPWFKNNIEIINEKAIIAENGDLKIPDRIIIDKDEITVIDFKFGKIHSEYSEQIAEYKKLLEKMYSGKVKGILYYVEIDKAVII